MDFHSFVPSGTNNEEIYSETAGCLVLKIKTGLVTNKYFSNMHMLLFHICMSEYNSMSLTVKIINLKSISKYKYRVIASQIFSFFGLSHYNLLLTRINKWFGIQTVINVNKKKLNKTLNCHKSIDQMLYFSFGNI